MCAITKRAPSNARDIPRQRLLPRRHGDADRGKFGVRQGAVARPLCEREAVVPLGAPAPAASSMDGDCPGLWYDRELVHASARPFVDLIIVNYQSYEELRRCLESLEPSQSWFARATVIDHESDLEAAAQIAARFPWVNLIERSTNEGFATGVNLGASASDAPFLFLLNPDCVAGGDAIMRLVDYAQRRSDAAVFGPRILNPDGTLQGSARRFPGLTTFVAGRSSWLTRQFPRNPLSRWNLPALGDSRDPIDVDWVSGACMLVRRSAYDEVGGMDGRFFLYWEDADLCTRLAQRGWRTVYVPAATVIHAGGRSSIHAYPESLSAFHASAFRLFRQHAHWPVRALAPLVYVALQLRLRMLLWLHHNRLFAAIPPHHGKAAKPARRAPPVEGFDSGPRR
jgi:GT2 family glycosyltransferase